MAYVSLESAYSSGLERKSCLLHLNKKCFSITACTAVTRPLVVFLAALNPNAKLCPYGRRVSPVLAHSALGGLTQEPKTKVLRAYNGTTVQQAINVMILYIINYQNIDCLIS